MSAVDAVMDRLLAITDLTAIVDSRVFALVLPEKAVLPAIRVQQIDRDDPMHLRGTVGFITSRVQVDHYVARTSGVDAKAIASSMAQAARGRYENGVATGLAGFSGAVGGSPPIQVSLIRLADEREEFEFEEKEDVRISQDYFVKWRQ